MLARQQKLVFKGKVLTGNPKSLVSLGVKEGATLLLLAAAPTAGAVAAAIAAAAAAAEAARKHAARKPAAAAASAAAAAASAASEPSRITEARVRAWASTGVVGLRGEGLSELPEALFAAVAPAPGSSSCSSSSSAAAASARAAKSPLAVARAVDLGENRLSSLPERFVEAATAGAAVSVAATAAAATAAPTAATTIGDATTTSGSGTSAAAASVLATTSKLARLRLADNALSGPGALPSSFSNLSALAELVLDDNPLLQTLPGSVFALPRLRRLSAVRCCLGEIPSSVQDAKALSELVVAGNALTTIPVEIGSCSSLTRLDASSNKISSLPENSLARCGRLTVLVLDGNRLSSLPRDLLSGAAALHTLGLRGNELTLDGLRATEGWEAFEGRRVKAADARLAGRVDVAGGKGAGAFDATADAEEWIKW